LTAETLRPVQAWLQERPQTPETVLFLNQHGRPLSVAGVQFRLKQYCDQAGVHLTCHQLRHTFARRLAEQSMPIDSLAKLLGHRNLQTTQGYIDGADPTLRLDFQQAMSRLNDLFPPPVTPAVESAVVSSFAPAQADERPNPQELLAQVVHLAADLPDWLGREIRLHTLRRIPRWQPHRAKAQTHMHFGTLCRICRWLVTYRHWQHLDQLQRTDLVAYVHARQVEGLKPRSIGAELTLFRMFWRDLLAQEQVSNSALLHVKAPVAEDHLPRYLTASEFQRLEQVVQSETAADTPQDCFNRTWFYLLAHTGVRISELLNLRLADCDLNGQRLRIQAGKGNRDRVIPLTDHLVACLQAYLVVREPAATDHLLIYKGAAVKAHLVPDRLRRFGHKAQVEPLSPHRLRHTLATFLVNQGMSIVSLQKFLGHQDINKTLIYARVHDETVRTQFTAAMAQIESTAVTDWPSQLSQLFHSAPFTAHMEDSV
jgi:site-specific recombinase XerD